MLRNRITAALVLASCVHISPVAAENRIVSGISALDFGYKEFDDGSNATLNREDGGIPGLVLGVHESRGPWFGDLRVSVHVGEVRYDGQTQAGTPAKTDTETLIVDLAYRFGYGFGARPQPIFSPYAGFGYRWWERDIQPGRDMNGEPVLGLEETYRWVYLLLGFEANLYRSPLSELGIDLRLTRPLNPRVDLEAFAGYESTTFDLGERTGGRAELYWRYRYARDVAWVLAPYYERWDIGRSPDTVLHSSGVPAALAFEPRSETRNYGISLSWERVF